MKKIITILFIGFLFISESKATEQYDTMFVVKFMSEILPNLDGDSLNFTSITSLNLLFDSFEVTSFIPYFPANTTNFDLRHFYGIFFKGNAENFADALYSTNIVLDIEYILPAIALCQNPVEILDEYIKEGWANNDALELVNAQCAWTITTGNPNLRLAIADTDFDENHEDLVDNIREIYGPITENAPHGTQVMGVAGATPNEIGIIGAGYNLKWDGSRVVHVIGSDGRARGNPGPAILAAYDKGARVINVSWTSTRLGSAIIQDMVDNGTVIVVAAGNVPSATHHISYANIPGVINVSGVDKDGNHGPTNTARNQWVDLCAVSDNVTATSHPSPKYTGTWGTSMAAPVVAATAGLLLSLNECFTPAQVEYIIKNTTQPIPDEHLYSGLLGTGYLDMYEAVKFAAGRSGTLSGNETWESLEIIGGKLIVPNGVTLTLKSEVLCYEDAIIYVETGGKLVVDGGTITSICDDKPWNGIVVEGNKNLNQLTASNQGVVEIKNNAVIENAIDAVFVCGLNSGGHVDWSKTGGLVRATNATFRNNQRDVAFLNYRNINPAITHSSNQEIDNYSFFRNCNFITDEHCQFPSNKITHITMYRVNGVKIEGCRFEDERTIEFPDLLAEGTKGVFAHFSSVHVRNYCTPMCSTNPSVFTNLKNGIEILGNGSRGHSLVENSVFETYYGIYANGTIKSTFRQNQFTIHHVGIEPLKTDYPWGIYLHYGTESFNTEGNTFNGEGNQSEDGAFGLVVNFSGAIHNEYYRSYFNGLNTGTQIIGENRNYTNGEGLHFICNEYSDGRFDASIVNDKQTPWPHISFVGVAANIGGGTVLPANVFSKGVEVEFNLQNTEGASFLYRYSGSDDEGNFYYPHEVEGNVTLEQVVATNFCVDMINSQTVNIATQRDFVFGTFPVIKEKDDFIDDVIDGGDFDFVVNTVNTATAGNVSQVVSDLISLSPYLSEGVLVLVAGLEAPFSHTMIRDILVANPHAARSPAV